MVDMDGGYDIRTYGTEEARVMPWVRPERIGPVDLEGTLIRSRREAMAQKKNTNLLIVAWQKPFVAQPQRAKKNLLRKLTTNGVITHFKMLTVKQKGTRQL